MATTPPIELEISTNLSDGARRLIALDHAVKLASSQQIGRYDAQIVVNMAQSFEAYLAGNDA